MSYKNLQIWLLAQEIVVEIHEMTLKLPGYEFYEVGSQTRRSSKSIKAAIVEGYGRRRYKADFIRYLIYAISSTDETTDHLETLFITKSLADEGKYQLLHSKLDLLGKKLNLFIQGVDRANWH